MTEPVCALRRIIYVRRLDAGVASWRPVPATPLGADRYQIEGNRAAGERWEFEPGTVVVCVSDSSSSAPRLLAIREA